jgi:hypothetical protein
MKISLWFVPLLSFFNIMSLFELNIDVSRLYSEKGVLGFYGTF